MEEPALTKDQPERFSRTIQTNKEDRQRQFRICLLGHKVRGQEKVRSESIFKVGHLPIIEWQVVPHKRN